MKSRSLLAAIRRWPAAVLAVAGLSSATTAAEGPGVPNLSYPPARVGEILSTINPQKAASAMVLHRGYLFMPLSTDGGGGSGAGAFAFYDVSDPANPSSVFDSRSEPARYHTAGAPDYVGGLGGDPSSPGLWRPDVALRAARQLCGILHLRRRAPV